MQDLLERVFVRVNEELAIDFDIAGRLPLHTQLVHPVHGRIRFVDQHFGQTFVDPPARHALRQLGDGPRLERLGELVVADILQRRAFAVEDLIGDAARLAQYRPTGFRVGVGNMRFPLINFNQLHLPLVSRKCVFAVYFAITLPEARNISVGREILPIFFSAKNANRRVAFY